MRAMRKLVPKNDRVKNKDRQNPVKVLKIWNNGVTNYLKDIGLTGHTAIPETSKFTNNNKVGMYSNPIGLLIGSYVSICMLTQLINLKLLHQHLRQTLYVTLRDVCFIAVLKHTCHLSLQIMVI